MAGIRDFFYFLMHHKEIKMEIRVLTDDMKETMELLDKQTRDLDEKMVFFIKSMCNAEPSGADIKIFIGKN